MSAVYALYPTADAAQRAVNALRSAGIADDAIAVASAEPMEHYEFGEMNRQTHIWYIASAGALLGLATGTWLTRTTEVAWPLPTGNMPIVAWWPNMIVMFELTMLGAILATVITLFITAKIPTREPKLYDPRVSDGKILVGVENPSDSSAGAIENALLSAGGAELKRV